MLTAYRGATGFGVRLDGGTAYSGARITPFYDSLLEKVTTWAPTPEEAILRMDRALREFRIRGVATNLAFLENVIGHPQFLDGSYTTRFVDETPELFSFVERQDRATRLLRYIGETIVNGNAAVEGRAEPPTRQAPGVPETGNADIPDGSRQRLDSLGPEGFARWMLEQTQVLMTDTTFRDAHQSLSGDAGSHARSGGDRPRLCAPPAGAPLGRVLGRRDLRRGDALSRRVPVGPARTPARRRCPTS